MLTGEFSFSRWLEDELKARNMTEQQLSEMTGITQAAISHYKNCKRFPTSVKMNDILNALGKRIVIVDKNM